MTGSKNKAIAALIFLGCLTMSACSSEERQYPVRVTVQLDGQPLPDATVYFYLQSGRGTAGGNAKNGSLEFMAPAGTHRVVINAIRLKEGRCLPPAGQPQPPGLWENYLPGRYNKDSKLVAEVTPEGPNEFAFDLDSTPDSPQSKSRLGR